MNPAIDVSRRRFLVTCTTLGLSGTLMPSAPRALQQLAAATASIDVYLAPSANSNPRTPEGATAPVPPPNNPQKRSQMANLACYPGLALPNGFAATGRADARAVHGRALRRRPAAGAGQRLSGRGWFHMKQPPAFAVA